MRFTGLALVMSAAVLGACGGGEKGATPGTDTAKPPATPSTTAAAPTATVPKVAATGKTVEIDMTGDGTTYKYEPASVTIKTGDNVRFVMKSGGPHNVTFDPAEIPASGRPQLTANMDNQMSELMGPLLSNPGDAYEVSFGGVPPGTYPFHCQPHLAMNMKGTITVTP
jgi:plastocyanin